MADPTPPQVSAHLESRPLQDRGRDVQDSGPGEAGMGVLGAKEMLPLPRGMQGHMSSAPSWTVENGATCLVSTAKPRGLGGRAGQVQLSLPRDSEGREPFSNNERNSHPMARRTLGQKTAYRGHLVLNTRLIVIREVPRARNSDCLESEVEPQRKEVLNSLAV